MLHVEAGGAHARPFVTHHNTLDMDMYLRIALELHLKRLIVGGLDRVFEIGRIFRNEGISTRHNPEFTMIELYEAFADYTEMMAISEALVVNAARDALGHDRHRRSAATEVDLAEPWRRVRMIDLVEEATGVAGAPVDAGRRRSARSPTEHGVGVNPAWGSGKIIEELFEATAESSLIHPTFVTGHPVEISPLARVDRNDPFLTERFEFFINGREHGNGYSELNDPVEQRLRFEDEQRAKAAGDDEAGSMDEDYLRALEYGLPPTGGLGIGVDRVAMLLAGVSSIKEVILFPTLRPEVFSGRGANECSLGRRHRHRGPARRGARRVVPAPRARPAAARRRRCSSAGRWRSIRAASAATWSRVEIDTDAPPASVADAYLRLHLLSNRLVLPRTINLDGIFGLLPINAWTNLGPIQPERVDEVRAVLMTEGPAAAGARPRPLPADDRLRHARAACASPTPTGCASAPTSPTAPW